MKITLSDSEEGLLLSYRNSYPFAMGVACMVKEGKAKVIRGGGGRYGGIPVLPTVTTCITLPANQVTSHIHSGVFGISRLGYKNI